MKIYLMTDMEGCAGILNHDDWVLPSGRYYEKGQRLLTGEVNAAVDGFFAAGATAVRVADGHGAGGIDPELLDERAELMRGWGDTIYPFLLDQEFDALAFVGQHAKAGTDYSHITHTQWFNYIDLAINDVSIGEYGQTALCARELGIPTIFAAGEEALAREAEALTPGVVTATVKRGLRRDGLENLDTDAYRKAKLDAIHLAPKAARNLIRKQAAAAVEKWRNTPKKFQYVKLQPPYVRTARFRQFGDQAPWSARDEHPDSVIALLNQAYTPVKPEG